MDAGNNFWQFHHFLKAFCILPPAEGNEIVEWVGLRDSKCTLVLQRCWTSKCPQGAARSLSETGSAQAHRNLKGLSSWWLAIAGAKDWTMAQCSKPGCPSFESTKQRLGLWKSRTGRVRRTGWQFYRKAIGRITTIIGERCPTNVAGTPITITSGSVWVSARLGGNLKASYRWAPHHGNSRGVACLCHQLLFCLCTSRPCDFFWIVRPILRTDPQFSWLRPRWLQSHISSRSPLLIQLSLLTSQLPDYVVFNCISFILRNPLPSDFRNVVYQCGSLFSQVIHGNSLNLSAQAKSCLP